MSKAQSTQGSKLFVETDVADTFIRIGEVTAVGSLTSDSTDDIDVTSLDSVAYKEYLAGLKEPPTADYSANYVADDVGQKRLSELFQNSKVVKFKLETGKPLTTTGTPLTIVRSGYISKFDIDTPVNSKISLNFAIRFSGEPAITEAA